VVLLLKSYSKSFYFVTKLLVLINLLLSKYLVIVYVADIFKFRIILVHSYSTPSRFWSLVYNFQQATPCI